MAHKSDQILIKTPNRLWSVISRAHTNLEMKFQDQIPKTQKFDGQDEKQAKKTTKQ